MMVKMGVVIAQTRYIFKNNNVVVNMSSLIDTMRRPNGTEKIRPYIKDRKFIFFYLCFLNDCTCLILIPLTDILKILFVDVPVNILLCKKYIIFEWSHSNNK